MAADSSIHGERVARCARPYQTRTRTAGPRLRSHGEQRTARALRAPHGPTASSDRSPAGPRGWLRLPGRSRWRFVEAILVEEVFNRGVRQVNLQHDRGRLDIRPHPAWIPAGVKARLANPSTTLTTRCCMTSSASAFPPSCAIRWGGEIDWTFPALTPCSPENGETCSLRSAARRASSRTRPGLLPG